MSENETLDKEQLNDENNETTAETEANCAKETAENNAEDAEKQEKDPLEAANEKIEELKDKYLRTVAEFDNYRKRTLKEKTELILNGGEKAISAILPVLDDMERAIANGAKTEEPEVLREGMELIFAKFQKPPLPIFLSTEIRRAIRSYARRLKTVIKFPQIRYA